MMFLVRYHMSNQSEVRETFQAKSVFDACQRAARRAHEQNAEVIEVEQKHQLIDIAGLVALSGLFFLAFTTLIP